MATLDDSPSLFSGQQWTDWADAVTIDTEPESEEADTADDNAAIDSMKLKLEDMPLFGHCPSRDEFYLVVCDKCNQVLKPQAFQTHLDLRHGGKGGYSTHSSSKSHHQSSSRHSVSSSSKSHSKTHSPSKSHSRSSHSKSHHSPNKSHRSHIPPSLPLKPINKELVNSGHGIASEEILTDDKSNMSMKASVKVPPQSLDAAAKVGAGINNTDKVNDSKSSCHSNNPVVKMERMPETLAMKKHRDLSGSAQTLTNGSVRSDSKSPPMLPMPVITDIEDIKDIVINDVSLDSPIPQLTLAHDNIESYMDEMITVPASESEINDAVSSILEPVSPVPEPEPGGFIALVTSSSTITTNTVTMATITPSTTSVTNVISTTSSFKFSSIGRPTLPMGSIRVNFSSTGVLSKVTSDGVGNVSNSNINNNSIVKTSSGSSESTRTSAIISDGNMESTISDIVKSAVNSGNTGGFKSLSPLLTSPPKSSTSNISFKSPPKMNLVKSNSGSNLTKIGSKLSPGASAVFKSNSVGNVGSSSGTATSSNGGNGGPVNTDAIKKFQLLNKPDKIIPLKDREYDPNKHCGVVVTETGKPCTRSLTCKSHALSLRRAVTGRRLPFDELLQEHRDAKEAYMKAKIESKEATAALKAAQAATKSQQPHTIVSPLGKVTSLPTGVTTTSVTKPNAHLNQTLPKDGKSVPVFVNKPAPVQRPASISSHRTSFGSIGSPSSQDELQSPTGKAGEKLGGEEDEDSAYTTHHPRPIAACSFGARYHNNYGNGFGCHTFGRRTDHIRAVFLDMLEKHSNPPPPKKLCVEANLPRENEFSDPYEFGFLDSGRNTIGQHIIQGPGLITSVAPNKVVSKQKLKPGVVVSGLIPGSKPKFKDAISLTKTPVCATVTPSLFNSASPAKKRRGSGSAGAHNVQASVGATLVTAASNILASVGAISHSAGANQQHQFIAIPSVNISGAALSQISANLVASGNLKHAKNNVIKDMGFYVTGIPQEALLNGQIVNITNPQLTTTDINATQMQPVTHEDGNKTLQQVNVITNSKHLPHQTTKFMNSITNIDAIRAIQAGKSSLITSLPPNAVLLDSNLQPAGTVLQPVTFTTSTVTPVMSIGNSVFSQNSTVSQHSAHSRSATNSPLATTSPLPNGVISNQSDKDVYLSQRHPVFQSKTVPQPVLQQTARGTIQHTPNMFTGAQLHNQNLTFHTTLANSTPLSNQISSNPNSVLPGHQIQVKNSLQKTGGVNKLQPVSITIPFVTQNNVGGNSTGIEIGGQQHTLYITSDHAPQNQGLHLQQTDIPAHNSSPTHPMIS